MTPEEMQAQIEQLTHERDIARVELLRGIDVTGPGVRSAPGGTCRIQRLVAGALDEFLDDAESLLARRLERITLASLRGRGPHRHTSRIGRWTTST